MSLYGKIGGQTEIKYCDGDVFHQLFSYKPYELANIIPHTVQGCSLEQGQWGAPGSIIVWDFVHEGTKGIHKDIVEAVDEEKKLVSFKVIEGYILEQFKSFKAILQVDTHDNKKLNAHDNKVVTNWTFEYEKLNEDIPDPQEFLDYHLQVTKDIDTFYKSPLN